MRGKRQPAQVDRRRRPRHWRQPEIAAEHTRFMQQQMPRGLVEVVEIWVRRSLLDDEDALTEPQNVIKFVCRQLLETKPSERDFRSDFWQALSPDPVKRAASCSRATMARFRTPRSTTGQNSNGRTARASRCGSSRISNSFH